ncbi:hypothetical protein DIS24_g257 [Lasiodiplodia hormozganensis]|uniref:Uncharacterized protein n=1 Tax=Lasiodiplodia hormozganensis TaxID=869390 RepID=A0AA39Z5Q8_9PEZI|nr:hypothetical protein DIS24_g257 [Lasiodiplodia hormozganensis]
MKLNYKNRKSEGPKLGHIVAKDLRKQTKHCFAKAEPRPEPSPLMLDLDGKSLTDEGCLAMIEGLEETLEMHSGISANKLEELHLRGNRLTTTSLRALAHVIELARFELVDIDLSDNNISVKTDEDANNWETFLKAFRGCRLLRRIDLSGNQLDGPRPFEILDRVYSKQPPVDPTQLEDVGGYTNGRESGIDSNSDVAELTNRARDISITSPTDDPPTANDGMSAGTVLKRREGLRAVPYIILSDTAMTDAGALFFSYIIQRHFYPQQLMCPLRPGPQAAQLDEYRQRNHCWGLVYLPNENLTETGLRLLGKAEDSRSEFTGIVDDFGLSDSVGSFVMVDAKQANSGLRRSSNASSIRRRSDSVAEPGKKHAIALDIENYRKKIQRNILEELGYDSIDLWRCAVKMLTYAKVLMLNHEQGEDSPLPIVDRADPIMQMMQTHLFASRMVATPSAHGDPVLAVTETTPEFTQLDVESWPSLPAPVGKPAPQKTSIHVAIEEEDGYERDSDLLGEIPEHVWKDILVQAAGAHHILSNAQQDAIVHYARDRTTARLEKGELGKPRPFKLWWILERMGCLAYEIKD